jgi:hypothetical protein
MKHAIRIQDASLGEKPPCCKDFFAEGSMLYSAENSITPKLKLNDMDKKVSLSCILKSRFPGNCRIIMSMQITEAPRMHATPLKEVMIHPRSSFVSTMVYESAQECRGGRANVVSRSRCWMNCYGT